MKLSSPAFEHNKRIPAKYTCQGSDCIPPLKIGGVPKNAKSLALILDDPDVPMSVRADQMWVHWVIFNMPTNLGEIEEGEVPKGIQGQNTGGQNAYMGPCPPDREHRYFFKLYALDTELSLRDGVTKEELLHAMEGHILARTELIGRYLKT